MLVAPPAGVVTTFAGNGSPGDAGDGESARMAQLNLPSACALDGSGDMFIADTANHRIREVTATGAIATVAGSGAAGYVGDGGAATAAELYAPSGVAVDGNGNLFIADTGNHAIRLVTPDGAIHTIAGQGTAGFSGDRGEGLAALDVYKRQGVSGSCWPGQRPCQRLRFRPTPSKPWPVVRTWAMADRPPRRRSAPFKAWP